MSSVEIKPSRKAVARLLFLLSALAQGVLPTWALDPTRGFSQFSYQTWQSENGLPQNTVQSILQTRDGYIWLGTEGGLVRFDGFQFIAHDTRTNSCLKSNNVRSLLEDDAGTLWVGTADGICLRRASRDRRVTVAEGLPSNTILALRKDNKSRIWVVTPDGVGELETLSTDRTLRFRSYVLGEGAPRLTGAAAFPGDGSIYLGTEAGLDVLRNGQILPEPGWRQESSSEAITALLADRRSRLWAGTSKGLSLRAKSGKTSDWRTVSGCPRSRIFGLLEDREGSIWIGSEAGLSRVENESCIAGQALSSGSVIALAEDAEGDLWAGTETQGVTIVRDQKFVTYTTRDGLASDGVRSVFQSRNGEMWVGTIDGLTRIVNGQFSRWTTRDGLSSNVILSLGEDAEGNLLAGTPDGLNRIHGGAVSIVTSADGLADDFVRSIFRDRDDSLWIGTRRGLSHSQGGRFKTYTQTDGLGSDLVGAVLRDRQGDLWIGTLGGLTKFSHGKFKNYRTKDGLSSNVITSLYEDSSGTLWIGTQSDGLNVRAGGRLIGLPAIDGLPRAVYGIMEDGFGNLWLSSNTGIARVRREELLHAAKNREKHLDVSWYGTSDGLLISEGSVGGHPDVWKAMDGTIWFSTAKGVATLDTRAAALNRIPPPIVLESVAVEDRSFSPAELSQIPAGTSRIAFNYAGLSFAAPQRVAYRYRLKHFDKSWNEAGTRRTAYYTNIPPGSYSFEVLARNNDGFWSRTEAAYRFTLQPRFYQTYWFYALVLTSLCLAGFLIYRWRVAEVEARFQAVLQERNRIAREIHDTLAQGFVGVSVQLEIVSRMLNASAGSAREHLDQARLQVRDSIAEARRSIWQLRSQSADTEDLAARVSKSAQQAVAGRPVKVSLEVHGTNRRLESRTEDELLRIAQEAVANALKHGDPELIRIELAFDARKLRLSIADNGRGFDVRNSSLTANGHYGLRGMRERAEQIEGSFSVKSEAGKGTTVMVEAPLS